MSYTRKVGDIVIHLDCTGHPEVPFDICMNQCTMITSKTVWNYNCPCIVLEYME